MMQSRIVTGDNELARSSAFYCRSMVIMGNLCFWLIGGGAAEDS